MGEKSIRILGPESEEDLIAFEHRCFLTDHWKKEDWRELLSDPRAVYYAMFDGERLVGNVFIYDWQGENDYIKIMSLAVHPDSRGRGLARELLRHVRTAAEKPGIRRVCAETRASNAAMQRVFDACSYRLSKIEEGLFDDPPESGYKYVLTL